MSRIGVSHAWKSDTGKRSTRALGGGRNLLLQGYTLIEVLIVMAIIGTLAAIASSTYSAFVDKARVVQAIADIREISLALTARSIDDALPGSLAAIGFGARRDPWGTPYQYFNIATAKGKGQLRKNKSLVPINSDFDLYSQGKDGKSQGPITAKASKDDIIRANNGGYIGLASLY